MEGEEVEEREMWGREQIVVEGDREGEKKPVASSSPKV